MPATKHIPARILTDLRENGDDFTARMTCGVAKLTTDDDCVQYFYNGAEIVKADRRFAPWSVFGFGGVSFETIADIRNHIDRTQGGR